MSFKVGIIGLGMIGESMLEAFVAHPDFEIGQVWDLNAEINARISNRFPQISIAQDGAEVIQHPEIDLIYIATPPLTHVDYGLQVIAADKALLCDKPLAIDLARGEALVEAAEAKGTKTAMNFVYGAGFLVDTLEQQLKSGRIGTPRSIEVRYQFPSWPLPNQLSAAGWITQRDAGGMIREMFSHFVYLLQRLFGPMVVKSTLLHYPEGPEEKNAAEDFVMASFEAAGIPVRLMGGIGGPAAPRESELTIHGSDGSLRLGNLFSLAISHDREWIPLSPAGDLPTPAQARLTELARRLGGEPTLLPDLRDGLRVQEVIETMLKEGY